MCSSIRWPRVLLAVLSSGIVVGVVVARKASVFASAASRERPSVPVDKALSAAGISALHAIADAANNKDLRWPDFAPYKAEFGKFYSNNGYGLIWVQNGHVRPQGLAVIELLKNASAKGLEPEDYDASRWAGRLAKLGGDPPEQELVSFDTALTVSARRYIRAVHVGRTNPQRIQLSDR